MQAFCATRIVLLFEQAPVRYLACSLASTFGHRKPGNLRDAISGCSQRIEGFAQSKPERAHDTRCRHRDTWSAAFSISNIGFGHFFGKEVSLRFLLLS